MRIWTTLHVRLLAPERGATMVEYSLMVALIALAIVGAVTALGLLLPDMFEPVSDTLG